MFAMLLRRTITTHQFPTAEADHGVRFRLIGHYELYTKICGKNTFEKSNNTSLLNRSIVHGFKAKWLIFMEDLPHRCSNCMRCLEP